MTQPDTYLVPHQVGGVPVVDVRAFLEKITPGRIDELWHTHTRPMAIEWVMKTHPRSRHSAQHSFYTAARYLFWANQNGLPLDPEVILTPRSIDAFIMSFGNVTDATRSSVRTRLRTFSLALLKRPPQTRPMYRASEKGIAVPYDREEEAQLWAAVDVQRTERRRRFMTTMLVGALGGGLRFPEIRDLRAKHISEGPSGLLLLAIGAPRERIVPLRMSVAPYLRDLMRRYPDECLAGPYTPQQRNPMTMMRNRLEIPVWCPALDHERLRSTWSVRLLDSGLRFDRFLEYAGLARYRFAQAAPYLSDRKDHVAQDLLLASGHTA